MKRYNFFYILFLFLLIFFFLNKMILFNMIPESADLINRIPIDNWAKNYKVNNQNMPQWFPNLFSGMPSYGGFIYAPADPIRKFFDFFNFNIGLRYFFHFLIASLGMFYYLLSINLSKKISLFGSICFSLTPYSFGLINAGHPAKLYAIAFIPLIILFSTKLIESGKIKYILLLSLFTAFQLWTKHVQIVYYTWMLVVFNWLWFVFSSVFNNKKLYKTYLKSFLFLIFSIIISVTSVANPYYSIYEFHNQSTRSSLNSTIESESNQQKWDYTTQWSFHPKELISFINPYFYGLQNFPTRDINSVSYWGMMPFTQSTHYMGFIVMLLTFIGFFINKLTSFYWSIIISTILIFIIGFGKFFPILFWPIYKFAPLFSSFRIPSMIYVLLPFTFSILSSLGLSGIFKYFKSKKEEDFYKILNPMFFLCGISFFFLLFGTYFTDFLKIGEQLKYDQTLLNQIKELRVSLYNKGFLLIIFQSIVAILLVYLVKKQFLRINLIVPIFIIILILDLIIINNEFFNLKNKSIISSRFRANKEVEFLQKNIAEFRIFPIEQFNSNWYSYFNIPSVGGYRPVKLLYYQDLIDNQALNNKNIQNMLNVKYLVTKQQFVDPTFSLVNVGKFNIYENLDVNQKAWFVDNIELSLEKESLAKILDNNFDSKNTAIIYDKNIDTNKVLKKGEIILSKYSENEIILNVINNGDGFLVLSEIYYSPGWDAFIDGKKINIFRTNHALRGVFVPKGEHEIVFKTKNNFYNLSYLISYSTFLSLIILSFIFFRPMRLIK